MYICKFRFWWGVRNDALEETKFEAAPAGYGAVSLRRHYREGQTPRWARVRYV